MEERLEKLLTAFRRLQAEQAEKCSAIDVKITDLQARRLVMAAPLARKLDKLTEVIVAEVLERGKAYVHPDFGKVGYRKGSVRVTWSNDLDELREDEDVWKKIKKYRRETGILPSAKIE